MYAITSFPGFVNHEESGDEAMHTTEGGSLQLHVYSYMSLNLPKTGTECVKKYDFYEKFLNATLAWYSNLRSFDDHSVCREIDTPC